MKKFINFRPLTYFAVSLCLGILIAYAFIFGKILLAVLLLTLSIFLHVALFLFYKGGERFCGKALVKVKLISIAVAVMLAVIGGVTYFLTVNSYQSADLKTMEYTLTARVASVSPTDSGSAVLLTDLRFSDESVKTDYKCMLYVYGATSLKAGDLISFTAELENRQVLYENRYSSTFVQDSIKYTALIDNKGLAVLDSDPTTFERVNEFIKNTLKNNMDEKAFTVSYAILCGNSDYVDDSVLENFRTAGVAHIFAVSGLHIGFCALVLNFLANKLNLNKYLKFFIIISVLLFYSGICGFTPSSLRATIMTGVMLIAELVGKKYDGLSSISFACILILLFSPAQLFLVGFQLSFGVVLGIALISRPIARLLKFLPHRLALSVGTVLSAQLFSLPITLTVFGYFSVVSALINLLFLPVVGVLYVFLFAMTLLGGLFAIPKITLFLPTQFMNILVDVINFFDYRGLVVSGIIVSSFSVFYYGGIVFASDRINLSTLSRTIVSISCVIVFVLGSVFSTVSYRNALKIIAVGEDGICASVVSCKDTDVLIVNYAKYTFPRGRLKRAVNELSINGFDSVIFVNGNERLDPVSALTIIFSITDVKSVYYAYPYDEIEILTLEEAFHNLTFHSIDRVKGFNVGELSFKVDLGGRVLTLEKGDESCCFISRLPSEQYFSTLNLLPKYSFVVSMSHFEKAKEKFSAKYCVSYLTTGGSPSAQETGNYIVKI
ncbi:MAG: ComEC/Rec2 family competence protein [Clostridiales bacterium]|nr:ComEC/Rec2 family competence protein [Clostridiales bacterium]